MAEAEREVLLEDGVKKEHRPCWRKIYDRVKRHYLKLLIVVGILALAHHYAHRRHLANLEYIKILPIGDCYVVLSSDLNLYYLIHMPIVIQYWKNKGVKSFLMITLKEGEEVDDDLAVTKVLDFVQEEYGTHIAYFRNDTLKTGQFAQTLRSFAAGTEFARTLDPDKTIFITSDADFFPNKLESHIPKLRQGKEILFYDHECCGHLRFHGERFRMYIMITIGMTLRRWREIIGIPDKPIDGPWVDRYVNQTFDGVISKKSAWWQWFLDQRLFGIKLKRWRDKHEEEFQRIVENVYRKGQPRLERFDWPEDDVLAKTDVWKRYESAHITPGIFMDHVWEKNLVFYNRIFPEDQVRKLTDYRNSVVKVMNVTETLRRHYHPEQEGTYWKKTFHIKGMLGEAKNKAKAKTKPKGSSE